jgi:flavin reductase (DIM6/NTAB) family NADH-FMN oxidoreductase RutF
VTVSASAELLDVEDARGVIDTATLRRAFGRFPTGVTAICAVEGGKPVGFTASSFNAVSADPPLVSLCVQDTSTTWPRLQRAGRIGVSVLSIEQALLGRQLASRSDDRFAGVRWVEGDGSALLLTGSAAWFETSIEFEQTVGDHKVIVLRVHRLGLDPERRPLVFGDSRFQELKPLPAPLKPGEDPAERAVSESLLWLGWW